MAFGFPAKHTEIYSGDTTKTDGLRVAANETLNALAWQKKEETPDQIIASTSISAGSFGETISINFLPNNSISITSKCASSTQCLDWGKNKGNTTKFIAEFKRALRRCNNVTITTNNNDSNDKASQIRQTLKQYDEFTEVSCLECGYEGKMGIIKSKVPWYFTWWVLIPVLLSGIGTIPAIILGVCRYASKKHTVECPSCNHTLVTK